MGLSNPHPLEGFSNPRPLGPKPRIIARLDYPPIRARMGLRGFSNRRSSGRFLEPLNTTRNEHLCYISLGLTRNRSKSSSSFRQQTLFYRSFWSPASYLARLQPHVEMYIYGIVFFKVFIVSSAWFDEMEYKSLEGKGGLDLSA